MTTEELTILRKRVRKGTSLINKIHVTEVKVKRYTFLEGQSISLEPALITAKCLEYIARLRELRKEFAEL